MLFIYFDDSFHNKAKSEQPLHGKGLQKKKNVNMKSIKEE